ncbi:MAG: thiamine diphosphokinase [Pseudomonadota bacterium]
MGVLNDSLKHAPLLAAADGGADTVLEAGLSPARVVGDLDSISDRARAAFAQITTHIAEQDSTDFAKALRTSTADLVIAVGFMGARVDHFLSCITELARRADMDAPPCVLFGETDCLCLLPPQAELRLPVGTRVSLWPLARAKGTSSGLAWPLDGVALDPTLRTGTSNHTVAPICRIRMSGGPTALILPAAQLAAMLTMLEIAPRGGAPVRL